MAYLTDIAAATGGRPMVNTNDFNPGLDSMFRENGSYYLLAFQSTKVAQDGTLRRLQVKVNRPGVDVRTRTGYYAPKEGDRAEMQKRAFPTDAAMAQVLPRTDLPMRATAAVFRGDATRRATVAIVVGVRQPVRTSDDRRVEKVDLRYGAYNTDGKAFGTGALKADVTLRPGASGEAEYELLAQLSLEPGRYQLRLGTTVGEPALSGSVYLDVVVPDFEREPISASDVILAVKDGLASAPANAFADLLPVAPTTARAFTQTSDVTAFARLYQGARSDAYDVEARWVIRDATDRIVFERSLDFAFGTRRVADVQLALPLATLAPGAYLLTLEASAGEFPVRRDSRFEVLK
jgi:hypothetical protein